MSDAANLLAGFIIGRHRSAIKEYGLDWDDEDPWPDPDWCVECSYDARVIPWPCEHLKLARAVWAQYAGAPQESTSGSDTPSGGQ